MNAYKLRININIKYQLFIEAIDLFTNFNNDYYGVSKIY